MRELVFFSIFLEKDLLKVDKILGLTFFQARKDFKGFKTVFFDLLLLSFVLDGLNSGFRNIYLATSWLGKYFATIHLHFKE